MGVDESALGEVEVNAGAQKFLGQQGHVEVVAVEACNVAAGKYLADLSCQLLEGGLVLDVVIRNASQLCYLVGNRLLGVNELVAAHLATIREYLNI